MGTTLADQSTHPEVLMAAQTVKDVMTTNVVYLPSETTLGEIVSRDLVTVRPEDTIHSAALLMRDHAVRRVLVCDDRGLVGIVSIGDLAEKIDPDSVLGGISQAAPNN